MSYPQYESTPLSPSMKQMAEEVATTSSRPPFGLESATGMEGSYMVVAGPGVKHTEALRHRGSLFPARCLRIARLETGSVINSGGSDTCLRLFLSRRLEHHRLTGVLLDDRQQPGVEEANLEQHEERQRAVDAVAERIEHRGREVQAQRQLDHRLHGEVLTVSLAD